KVRTFDVLPKVFFSYDSIVGFLHLFFFTPTAPSDSYTLSLHDALPISKQRGFDYQYGAMIGELDYFTHEEHGVLDWFRDNKPAVDRKSTRLNSSHVSISYAVFCLKKKNRAALRWNLGDLTSTPTFMAQN